MGIKDFYHLDVWKESHKLAVKVYKITEKFPKKERFGLTDQVRRASASISANIAEGFGRYHFADKKKFYYQARGSLKEVQSFIILSRSLNYATKEDTEIIWEKTVKCEKLLNGLIRSVGQSN